ncbi:hypothetical protein [Coastal Plains virus]|uniref:Uncharacterized protein U3 n=1 Tax=Coastal Plains virus TaxID=764599 RepID=D8V086_9RHAB|nr:hypothetical protein [Coastal Plains virus]ADG86363.1 hypothetical protein [Coastal Plains virus]
MHETSSPNLRFGEQISNELKRFSESFMEWWHKLYIIVILVAGCYVLHKVTKLFSKIIKFISFVRGKIKTRKRGKQGKVCSHKFKVKLGKRNVKRSNLILTEVT